MSGIIKKIFLTAIPLILLLFFFFKFSANTFSEQKPQLPAITIINLIRGKELGHEKDNLLSSLKAQWQITNQENVNATWLWQYSALEDNSLTGFAKKSMPGQEFGLLLEIDRNFAQKSGVQYRGQGPSYFSDGLLLDSYDISERHKLIDTAFSRFKKTFGYYPKTVGAWWIGADSINYMQKKYGIVAVLKASEQYNVDVYSIWGTPWSIPYLSSVQNEGIPANSYGTSSKVVILQWAARDPFLGYSNGGYSLQDFDSNGLNADYFDYLSSIYLKQPLDNIVIGLENGGTLATFKGHYLTVLNEAKKLEATHKDTIMLAKNYAKDVLLKKTVFPGTQYFLSKEFNSDNQSFWYNSINYRAGLVKEGSDIYLIDLRNYADKVNEDFNYLPNSQGYLRINEPAIVDSMRNPGEKLLIATASGSLSINKQAGSVSLYAGSNKIAVFSLTSLHIGNHTYNFLHKNSYVNVFYYLTALYLLYFLFIYWKTRNRKKTFSYFILSAIPLLIAYPFLLKGQLTGATFVFDPKEILLLSIFPQITNLSIPSSLIIYQSLFLILFLPIHYLLIIKYSETKNTVLYFIYTVFLIFIFSHISYFPLNRSTLISVLIIFLLSAGTMLIITAVLYFKMKLKKTALTLLLLIPIVLLLFGLTVLFSRTRIALTPFQTDALSLIKSQHKNVLFVYEADYSIHPIYKAVKPLISYDNYTFAEKLTNTSWQMVERPQNHVLKLTNYGNKLIVVPRFLGADLSPYEMKTLKLKKIFDNAQIAIFEKI